MSVTRYEQVGPAGIQYVGIGNVKRKNWWVVLIAHKREQTSRRSTEIYNNATKNPPVHHALASA